MVYYNKKEKRYKLGNAPVNKNIIVDSPPKKVPVPIGATYEKWVDLNPDQCQFHLDDFFDGPSNLFPCCGLPVAGGKGRGRRFCEYHEKVSKVGVPKE